MQRYAPTVCTIVAACIMMVLASIALVVNTTIFKFPGNNYFPPDVPLAAIILLLTMLGCRIQYGKHSAIVQITKAIMYYFLIMSIIVVATNAIQYTPFPTIDKTIITWELIFDIRIEKIVSWTVSHPIFTTILAYIYDSLAYQMGVIPLFVILMRRFSYLNEYFCLLLVSAIIGFTFYYFFPTVAPAMATQSPVFSGDQYATGIKFNEIHNYIQPSTIAGGMIALPSFHAIWAWLCLFMLRWFRLAFVLLLPFNALLIASCVLLGWHYPLDLLASLIVLLITHTLCFYCSKLTSITLKRSPY